MIALDSEHDAPGHELNSLSQITCSFTTEQKKIFRNYIEQLVGDCCRRLDIEFGIQYRKKKNQLGKPAFIGLLKSIKAQNFHIREQYLQNIATLFQQNGMKQTAIVLKLSDVSLSGTHSVEEEYAIKMIIRNLNDLFQDELDSLKGSFSSIQGDRVIEQIEMPIAPEHLVYALGLVIRELDLKAEHKIALYKVFETNVFIHLGAIYKELINSLSLQATANNIEPVELEIAVQESSVNEDWKDIVDQWRTKKSVSGYDLLQAAHHSEYEIYEILNGLEIIRHFTRYEEIDFDSFLPSIKSLLFEKLEAINPDEKKNINPEQEYVLDFVSILFHHIHQDQTIALELRKSILQLEIPLSVLALSNSEFLLSKNGSGQKLINQLYDAVQFINLDEEGHFVIKRKIDKLINKVCSDSSCGVDEIAAIVADFSITMEKNRTRYNVIQQRTLKVSINKELLELGKKAVNKTLCETIENQFLPEKITDFLFDVWQQFLLLTYLAKDEEPQRWQDSLSTMKMLIKSVVSPLDELDRKETINLLPVLIKDLRYGLKAIAYDKQLQARFFKELAVFHVLLINKNKIRGIKNRLPESISVDNDQVTEEVVVDQVSSKMAAIEINQWLLFTQDSTMRYGKYIWHSENGQNYLFVEKTGNKLYELSAQELSLLFDKAQVSFISYNPQPFSERVLNQI